MQHTRHSQFPQDDLLIYFNHAAVAPLPRCAAEAIRDFADEAMRMGSWNYPRWMQHIEELRELCRWLINAPSADDIALVKNTSEGLSMVAYGIDWQAGDNIVIPADEFPSNIIVWESLAQFGVETRQVDIRQADIPEQALIDACDGRTRLMSVSAVQYSDGFRLDLPVLGNHCRPAGILFVVDAIQQLGALEFDVQAIQADFVVADGHKWMLGLEGLGLFYSRTDLRESLKLTQFGWHMVSHAGDFTRKGWQASKTATRFECGSPNVIASYALHASLSLLQETGIENIQESILTNTDNIIDFIENNHYTLLSKTDPLRRSGIITFRHKTLTNAALLKALKTEQVQCIERGNGIRVSPHYYHQEWEFDRFFNILSDL